MSRLKNLVRTEAGTPPLGSGHSLCQGCGIPLVVRTVLDSIPGRKVVVNATGCLEVATTRYPTTAWNVPWLHVAFENAAAVASGVEAAARRRGETATIVSSSSCGRPPRRRSARYALSTPLAAAAAFSKATCSQGTFQAVVG